MDVSNIVIHFLATDSRRRRLAEDFSHYANPIYQHVAGSKIISNILELLQSQ